MHILLAKSFELGAQALYAATAGKNISPRRKRTATNHNRLHSSRWTRDLILYIKQLIREGQKVLERRASLTQATIPLLFF